MVTTFLLLALLFIVGFLNIYFAFSPDKFYAWIRSLFSDTCSSSPSVNFNTTQKMSVTERGDLKRVFATFDKNGDGFITKQELRESLTNIRMFLTENDVEEIVAKLDLNGDGLIDFNEFLKLCEAIDNGDYGNDGGSDEGDPKESPEEGDAYDYEGEMLKEAFDVFDRDHDGWITVEELGWVLSSLGLMEGDTIDDCREMIRKVDTDGDEMVDFDEFKTMMKNSGPLVPISALSSKT